jgi:hypothetical protein
VFGGHSRLSLVPGNLIRPYQGIQYSLISPENSLLRASLQGSVEEVDSGLEI